MRLRINILLVFIALIVFSACKKEEVPLITSKAGIYWGRPEYTYPIYYAQADSSNVFNLIYYSFGFVPVTQKFATPDLWVSVIGGTPVNYDRSFSIQVIKDSTTAVAGVDYELPASFAIKAGQLSERIQLKLLRTAPLLTKAAKLALKLIPGESFKDATQYSTQDVIDRVVASGSGSATNKVGKIVYDIVKVSFDDIQGEPPYWEYYANNYTYQDYMGKYSRKKMDLLINVAGMPIDFFVLGPAGMTASGTFSQRFLFDSMVDKYKRILNAYLAEQSAKGTPVLEADGTPMNLG